MIRDLIDRRIHRVFHRTLPFLLAALLLASCGGSGSAVEGDSPFATLSLVVNSVTDAVDVLPGDGLCVTVNGDCTLRASVQEANAWPGDAVVELPEGLYLLELAGPDEDLSATGDLDVNGNLVIIGAGAENTTVDGGLSDRVLHVLDLGGKGISVRIEGITMRSGYVMNQNGGGVLIGGTGSCGGGGGKGGEGGNKGGGHEDGGGCGQDAGEPSTHEENRVTVVLVGCVISGNRADSDTLDEYSQRVGGSGGGLASEGVVSIVNSTVKENSAAARGGGLYVSAALDLKHSTVSDNSAEDGGGLFAAGKHSSAIRGSTFSGNTAASGGAVASRRQVALDIKNSTLSGNTASDMGGGINSNGYIRIESSTVAYNVTIGDPGSVGGGLNSFACIGAKKGGFDIHNTILAGNAAGERKANCGCLGSSCRPPVLSLGYNLEDSNTCGFSEPSDMTDTDPLLGTLQDNGGLTFTHALMPGSPAVDSGGAGCPPNDQRGMPRPGDGSSGNDIGAYEWHAGL